MINRIINLINPDNKDLSTLSKDELLELLTKLNRCLRCLDESENVIEENMMAGDLVSPTHEVQMKVLEYLTQNISKVQDKKARAAMVYYTLLNLHMFSDGNGRTSRFVYDLISGDLSEERISYYFHKNSNYVEEQINNLEDSKGILDIYWVNQIPDDLLRSQLSFIPKDILEKYNWITVGHTDSSPTTESIIPKSVLEQLSKKEIKDLDKILLDGYGQSLAPSGLAMLYVSNKRGELSEWININDRKAREAEKVGLTGMANRLNFSIYSNPGMIADWTSDDFREVINVGNAVKYARLKCLIDVFVEPEKYINVDSGNPYLNDILGESKINKNDKLTR